MTPEKESEVLAKIDLLIDMVRDLDTTVRGRVEGISRRLPTGIAYSPPNCETAR